MSNETNRMDSSQLKAFLDEPRHAIAAVLRPNGEAQLSPIWFLYEADRLYFSVHQESAKYRQLCRDSRSHSALMPVIQTHGPSSSRVLRSSSPKRAPNGQILSGESSAATTRAMKTRIAGRLRSKGRVRECSLWYRPHESSAGITTDLWWVWD